METLKEYAELCSPPPQKCTPTIDPVLVEREACARLCEMWGLDQYAKYYAALIRARDSKAFNKHVLQQP